MKINEEDKIVIAVRHFCLAASCLAIGGWIIGCAAPSDEHGGDDGPSDSLTFEAIDDGLSDSTATSDVFVECEQGSQCESAFDLVTTDATEEGSHRVIFDVPVRLFNFFDDRYTESLIEEVVSQLNGSPLGEAAGFRFTIAPNDIFFGNAPSDMTMAQAVSFVRNYHRQYPGTRRSDRMPLYVFHGLAWSDAADLGGFAMIPGILQRLTPQTSGVYLNYFGLDSSLPHEVGHWLGLSHTFRGGCNPLLGDHVSDTPAHNLSRHPYSWCDATLDTCSSPGTDPIRNLMNYTPCNPPELTNGQITRMRTIWQRVYAPLFN